MTAIERLKKQIEESDAHDFDTVDRAVFLYIETSLMDNGKEGEIGLKLLNIIKNDLMP